MMISKRKETGKQKDQSKERSTITNATAEGNGKSRNVKFQLRAPEGNEVFVAGSFNNWDSNAIQLKHNGSGIYATNVSLAPGRHEYKFLVNGVWQLDEQCRQLIPNSLGSHNNMVEVT